MQAKRRVRIVSMMCRELFEAQDEAYRSAVLPPETRVVVAEAGVGCGWEGIASGRRDMLCINRFGESGKADQVAAHLGFTAEALAELIAK
jgi:transketolase